MYLYLFLRPLKINLVSILRVRGALINIIFNLVVEQKKPRLSKFTRITINLP